MTGVAALAQNPATVPSPVSGRAPEREPRRGGDPGPVGAAADRARTPSYDTGGLPDTTQLQPPLAMPLYGRTQYSKFW